MRYHITNQALIQNKQSYKKERMKIWKIIGYFFASPFILMAGAIGLGILLVAGLVIVLWWIIKTIFWVSIISDILD